MTEEEPFLYTDASGNNRVFVPAVQTNSSGTSWSSGTEAGSSLPLSSFFIANPSTSVAAIDVALALGKNLVLTPGVYNLSAPIIVTRPDTVVLGLGFATLVPQHGNAALVVLPNKGVKVSGLIVDAGPVNSPALVSVGTPLPAAGSATDPDTIQDVFFRIGGAETTTTSATVSLLDNASNSIIDDVWAWRADHGNDVGWTENKADTGLVVTGNDVTAYGLAVEHYQKSEVVWTGQGGTDVFFQNELPYDVPSQSAWNESATFTGYPAFQVGQQREDLQGLRHGQLRGVHRQQQLPDQRHRGVPGRRRRPGCSSTTCSACRSAATAVSTRSSTAPAERSTRPLTRESASRWTHPTTPADLVAAARAGDLSRSPARAAVYGLCGQRTRARRNFPVRSVAPAASGVPSRSW